MVAISLVFAFEKTSQSWLMHVRIFEGVIRIKVRSLCPCVSLVNLESVFLFVIDPQYSVHPVDMHAQMDIKEFGRAL